MNTQIAKLVGLVLESALEYVTVDKYQEVGDMILDAIEDKIDATDTQWDDILLEPILKKVRQVTGIEDNDDVDTDK